MQDSLRRFKADIFQAQCGGALCRRPDRVQAALARAREIQGDFAGIGRELARELEHRPL